MDFNKQMPSKEPRKSQYRSFNGKAPYLFLLNNKISSNPADFFVHNMTESFVSEDQVHCPCTDYKVEKVKDPVFN
jgi:hypothetical protein